MFPLGNDLIVQDIVNRLHKPFTLMVLTGSFIFSNQVLADHTIYSPRVDFGELELELKGHVIDDSRDEVDGEQVIVVEAGYGFTNNLFVSALVEIEKEPNASMEAEAAALEAIYTLTEPGQYWADYAVYVETEFGLESEYPDKLELKLLVEKEISRYVNTLNLIAEKEYGNNAEDETEFEYAWRTQYRMQRSLEPGIEIYGNFESGDEEYLALGPVIFGEFPLTNGKFKYEAGILFAGNNNTPDNTLKWTIEYEFLY